jgi:anti-sigma-K factor RskA
MADPSGSPPDREALAAELALGLLEGADRAEALRLCLSDPAFAAEVEAWGLRLSPLLGTIATVDPPAHVWTAIAARTGGHDAVVRSLRRWRGGAMVSGAIAACLALFIAMRPADVQPPAPIAISQLSGAGAATLAIAYDSRQGLLRLSPGSIESGARSPELWVIPDDGVPRSLGIVRTDGRAVAVDAALAKLLRSGATLAITLEDAASAPHKAPSSPPILTGKIMII